MANWLAAIARPSAGGQLHRLPAQPWPGHVRPAPISPSQWPGGPQDSAALGHTSCSPVVASVTVRQEGVSNRSPQPMPRARRFARPRALVVVGTPAEACHHHFTEPPAELISNTRNWHRCNANAAVSRTIIATAQQSLRATRLELLDAAERGDAGRSMGGAPCASTTQPLRWPVHAERLPGGARTGSTGLVCEIAKARPRGGGPHHLRLRGRREDLEEHLAVASRTII
jgi:hypothetical protein